MGAGRASSPITTIQAGCVRVEAFLPAGRSFCILVLLLGVRSWSLAAVLWCVRGATSRRKL